MKAKKWSIIIIIVILFSQFLSIHDLPSSLPLTKAQQDDPRFLISPYHGAIGAAGLESWFDHRFPNTSEDGKLLKYFSEEVGNASPETCNSGWEGSCYDGHQGYDFDINYEQVLAAASGTVSVAGWYNNLCHNGDNCGYGLYVVLQHSEYGTNYRTYYGHLATIAVHVGQTIYKGTVIGTSGSTGSSTGPHLHFEVRIQTGGTYRVIDPFGWQPEPGSPIQNDPWEGEANGARSWCMWIDGEWADRCPTSSDYPISIPSRPLPGPIYGSELIKNDTTNNSNGFQKGRGGLGNNPCTGADPNCPSWWNVTGSGIGDHAYRTLADGQQIIDNWAKWRPEELPLYSSPYETFVWIPSVPGISSNTFTWEAGFIIVDGQNVNWNKKVDQYIGSGQNYNPRDKWLSLGIHYLTNVYPTWAHDATGEAQNGHCPNGSNGWCRMAIDAVKFVRLGTNYLPHVEPNDPPSSPWFTPIIMSNNGGGTSRGKINYLEYTGQHRCSDFPVINGLGQSVKTQSCALDSAIIDSSENVSAVNIHRLDPSIEAQAYTGISVSNDYPIRASTENYLPTVYAYYYDFDSTIIVQNTSDDYSTYIHGEFREQTSSNIKGDWYTTLAPRQSIKFNLNSSFGWTNFIGTGIIYAGEPVAVIVESINTDDSIRMSYNALPIGTDNVYLPYLMKNYGGWNSCFVVQNTADNSTTVNIKYYRDNGTTLTRSFSLGAKKAKTECQSNIANLDGASSAHIWTSNPSTPIAIMVNQDKGAYNQVMSYSGLYIEDISPRVYYVTLPYLVRTYLDQFSDVWDSGFRIQNIGSQSTTVTAWFYDDTGELFKKQSWTINVKRGVGVYLASIGIPYGFNGSAILSASEPILVLANASCSNGCPVGSDNSLTYNGINN